VHPSLNALGARKNGKCLDLIPPPPSSLDGYQKKGVVGGAICMVIKTEGIENLGGVGNSSWVALDTNHDSTEQV